MIQGMGNWRHSLSFSKAKQSHLLPRSVWRSFCSFKTKVGFQFIQKKDANVLFQKKKQNKKRKNLMTCNYTMIQGMGNWRHFIIIHYSKEFILAATQNMYEYCIRLNIWCRHTVTYYVNAYCRKGNRSDLCRSPKRNSHIYVNLWSP